MVDYYILRLIENVNTTGLYNINDAINNIIRKNTTYLSILPREIINIIISNIPIIINKGDIIKMDNHPYFKVINKFVNINKEYGTYDIMYMYCDIVDKNINFLIKSSNWVESNSGFKFDSSAHFFSMSEKNIYHTIDKRHCNIV